MEKNINVLKKLCCGLALLGSTVVTVSGSSDPDLLEFLRGYEFPRPFAALSLYVRDKLSSSGGVGPAGIEVWTNDPLHRNQGEHPLRTRIQAFFRGQGNYQNLMTEAGKCVRSMQDPGIYSVPIETIANAPLSSEGNALNPQVYVVLGLPVESLQHCGPAEGAIVQVASQFNGLESVNSEITPLWQWVSDRTQGPGACMQALTSTALRCAAQEQERLPDAILPLLESATVSGGGQPILEKYPDLYQNGYLQLSQIRNQDDLEAFARYMEENAKKLRIQAQWVLCEEAWKAQLQVFCAAPSFQGININWNDGDSRIKAYKRISIALLRAQYEALARMARLSGRPLHLTAVGMGAFNNPPEALNEALKVVLQVLENSEVPVYLHGYALADIGRWNQALEASGYEGVTFASENPGFRPIAETKKKAVSRAMVSRPVDLDFFAYPNISGETEILSQCVRKALSFSGRMNQEKIKVWEKNPTHCDERDHPLRTSLSKFLVGEQKGSQNYEQLMKQAREAVSGMMEPVVSSVSLEDINAIQNRSLVHVVLGLPVESLQHWRPADGAIIQVASQFNGLESSDSSAITPLWELVNIRAQGPGICLQTLAAAALRCAAQEKGMLPDAILPLLREYQVNDNNNSQRKLPILRRYPDLYKNGYLRLEAISDQNDLEIFARYMEENAKKLRIQAQWVRCEESGTAQLQVFCAAPSFSEDIIDWSDDDPIINAYKRISIALLKAQYETLARMALLAHRPLHLTAVGMGAFNNPPEALNEALRVVLQVLENSGVPVYLHGYAPADIEKWNRALDASGYEGVNFDFGSPNLNPIAETKQK
ncbi:MAG: hypothetical protein LBQ03_00550 [Puniceicoccales bacterium]|nr:hypothetical protein [Puniceicoccales bacterium]